MIVPTRVWKQLYVRGFTPAEAAEKADISAYNVKRSSTHCYQCLSD